MALARLGLRAIARAASGSLVSELRPLLPLSGHLGQLPATSTSQLTTVSSICSCSALHDAHSPTSLPTASSGRDRNMAIVFTCTKCDTRSAKTFSRQSYENGIVLIRCPGCKSLHLIADHLGWFGEEPFKVEDLASQVEVRRVDATEQAAGELRAHLTAEDVAGWSRVEAVAAAAAGATPAASSQAGAASLEQDEVLQLDPADLEAWQRVKEQGAGPSDSS